jgi:hypothetical protein
LLLSTANASTPKYLTAHRLFVDKARQQSADAVFDDRLVMLSPKVLIQQMVQAQRLP